MIVRIISTIRRTMVLFCYTLKMLTQSMGQSRSGSVIHQISSTNPSPPPKKKDALQIIDPQGLAESERG